MQPWGKNHPHVGGYPHNEGGFPACNGSEARWKPAHRLRGQLFNPDLTQTALKRARTTPITHLTPIFDRSFAGPAGMGPAHGNHFTLRRSPLGTE